MDNNSPTFNLNFMIHMHVMYSCMLNEGIHKTREKTMYVLIIKKGTKKDTTRE